MIRRRRLLYYYLQNHFKATKTPLTTCVLPVEAPQQPPQTDQKSLCLSLLNDLLQRGLYSNAKEVVKRIIYQSRSHSDAISGLGLASANGFEDVSLYSALIREWVDSSRYELACSVYYARVSGRIEPDSDLLNSMVVGLVILQRFEEAMGFFERLIREGCVPCMRACNLVFRELLVKEMFLEVFYLFFKINNCKLQFGMWLYNGLIYGLCDKGFVDEAYKVFEEMCRRSGFLPTLHQYKTLYFGFCKKGLVLEAQLVLGDVERRGYFVDKVMYTSLINACCKNKMIDVAMMAYIRMLKAGCDCDVFLYNTLIKGFLRMELYDDGYKLYDQMIELGIQPNRVTYDVFITGYCKAGKVDSAITLVKNMALQGLVPGVCGYTAIVDALYRENRFGEIDRVYRSMIDSNIVLDDVLYDILRKNYSENVEHKFFQLTLKLIAKIGCRLDSSVILNSANESCMVDLDQDTEFLLSEIVKSDIDLGGHAFSIVISALCRRGKAEVAYAWFAKMTSVGCKPSLLTFNSLIKCLSENGQFEDGWSLIDIMEEYGMFPNLPTYLILVKEHCKRRDVGSAFNVVDHMIKYGLKPGIPIYNLILGCLFGEKRVSEAETLFCRMLKLEMEPDESVCTTMIRGYFKNGRVRQAQRLFKKMEEKSVIPTLDCYTVVISELVKRNMLDEGRDYLARMRADGIVPNVVLYTSLVHSFLRKREIGFAFYLANLMEKNQIEADVGFYVSVTSGFCRYFICRKRSLCDEHKVSRRSREMLYDLLLHQFPLPEEHLLDVTSNSPEKMERAGLMLVEKIKGCRFMPNLALYNSILSVFCFLDKLQDANEHFEQMQRDDIRPNEVTFSILIGGHGRSGDIDRAIWLFNMMNSKGCTPDKLTYNILLKGLCKAGRASDALSLLYAMHKRGFMPGKVSYENLLRCFCRISSSSSAVKVFEEMQCYNFFPRRYGGSWLLHVLWKENKLAKAQEVFTKMVEKEKYPSEWIRRRLAKASKKQREATFPSCG